MTLPALRQEVQTLSRFGVTPFTSVRTRWMLGFQRRLVRRCECEMLCPKPGPLPQTSQLAATGDLLGDVERLVFGGPQEQARNRTRVAEPHPSNQNASRGASVQPVRVRPCPTSSPLPTPVTGPC